MFNNLVESDLHKNENARRSWFFLCTLAAYGLFLMFAGVVSIYAYDARLEEQTNEYTITFVPPVQTVEATPERKAEPKAAAAAAGSTRHVTERQQAIARIGDSTKPPAEISSVPSKVRELPGTGPFAITGRDTDVGVTGIPDGVARNNNPIGETPRTVKIEIEEAPSRVTPTPAPLKVLKVSQVLNGRAVSLPKPAYPRMALSVRASGVVTVQVLIDETGRVVSAQSVSGHPLLLAAAVQAARQARFSPTILGDRPVKVSGVITYNFTL